MFRERLPESQGMLFIFEEEALHAFWMKNMKFPIDIIWINREKKIADIQRSVQPCTEKCDNLIPQAPSQYAFEVPAGFVEKQQIKIGQQADF